MAGGQGGRGGAGGGDGGDGGRVPAAPAPAPARRPYGWQGQGVRLWWLMCCPPACRVGVGGLSVGVRRGGWGGGPPAHTPSPTSQRLHMEINIPLRITVTSGLSGLGGHQRSEVWSVC